jgi:hypothetical protein
MQSPPSLMCLLRCVLKGMGPTRLPPSVAALLEALKGPEPLTCFRAPPFSPAIERQMTELLR